MGNLSLPRPRIHLIYSKSSYTFIGLARHEAGWPWVDSMSRSKVYRHVSCFYKRADNFQPESTGSVACSRVDKTNERFLPVFPIAAVRAYLQPFFFFYQFGKKTLQHRFVIGLMHDFAPPKKSSCDFFVL